MYPRCDVALPTERLGHHSLGAAKPPPVVRQAPTARRCATAVTLPPPLTRRETKATWTEAAALRLHAPASPCAYPSLLFPRQLLPRASWLTCGTVFQSSGRQRCHSPAPQVLNLLIYRCRRSRHTSGWRHDSSCRRGAFPSASELVVMCVRAQPPLGCSACIGPCRSSCGTIRDRPALPPPAWLLVCFPITKCAHPVPEDAFLCLERPPKCL